MRPLADRVEAWQRLANMIDEIAVGEIGTLIGLDEVVVTAEKLMAGKVRGRVIVDVNK